MQVQSLRSSYTEKGERLEVLMHIRSGSGIDLILIDRAHGARELVDRDEVFYTSPNYNRIRHIAGDYCWILLGKDCIHIDVKNNEEAIGYLQNRQTNTQKIKQELPF